MSISNYAENKLLDAVGGTSFSVTTAYCSCIWVILVRMVRLMLRVNQLVSRVRLMLLRLVRWLLLRLLSGRMCLRLRRIRIGRCGMLRRRVIVCGLGRWLRLLL